MLDDFLAMALYCLMALSIVGYSTHIFNVWQMIVGVVLSLAVAYFWPWKGKY